VGWLLSLPAVPPDAPEPSDGPKQVSLTSTPVEDSGRGTPPIMCPIPPFDLKLEPTDRCPCGSGKRLKDCCLPTNFRPEACQTTPKAPQTRVSYPTCYAQSLEDCGGKRATGEHFISRNILELLSTLGVDPNAPLYGMVMPSSIGTRRIGG
jgi:hypothetical protein